MPEERPVGMPVRGALAPSIELPVAFLEEMAQAENLDALLGTIAQWVGVIIPSARCSIALLEGDERLRVFALTGCDILPNTLPLPVEGSNPGRAIQSRRSIVLGDIASGDAIENDSLIAAGLRSLVCTPLISAGQCFGSLNVGDTAADRYSEMDVQQLRGVALWIASQINMVRKIELLSRRAMTDELTGVPNRRAFNEMSTVAFNQWRRGASTFGLLLLDVDHFKAINDRYGHPTGDLVLANMARRILARKRGADMLARIGGEEFAMLLSGVDPDYLLTVGDSYRALVEQSTLCPSIPSLQLTASIGLTMPCDVDQSFADVMARADEALYRAKSEGRNRVVRAG